MTATRATIHRWSAPTGRFLVAYFFTVLLLMLHLGLTGRGNELYSMAVPWHGIASLVLPLAAVALGRPAPAAIGRGRLLLAGFAASLLLILPGFFSMIAFGTRELPQILLYLAHADVGAATAMLLAEHLERLGRIVLAMLLLLAAARFLITRVRGFGPALLALTLVLFTQSLPVAVAGMYWSSHSAAALIDPETDVRRPVILQEPAAPKNLLLIYFESMEEAIAHLPPTREAFAPLEALSADGLRLRGIGQYPGTDYSAGGIAATQCGVPLLTPHGSYFMPGDGNRAQRMGPVMPTLHCLGDILAERGYRTAFFNGADLRGWGIASFLRSHGYETVFDLAAFEAEGLAGQRNHWGVEDDVFYARVRQELRQLAAGDAPFLLALENTGTHPPDGYPDPSCGPVPPGRALPFAIACGVRHIMELLAEAEALGLNDNTLIVIVSDHLMMSSTLNRDFRAYGGPRHNFALILNAGMSGALLREASLMDVYPTLLELMGFTIADGRAGLGLSFMAEGQTLAERLGAEALDTALRLNMPLSRHLWRPPPEEEATP